MTQADVSETRNTPEDQEKLDQIGKTLDVLARSEFNGFTGFSNYRSTSGEQITGLVDRDAGGKYVDPTLPEADQTIVIPMTQLGEAHDFVRKNGTINDGKFEVEIQGIKKQVSEKSIYNLTNNVWLHGD